MGRHKRPGFGFIAAFTLSCAAGIPSAKAYIQTLSPSGAAVRWKPGFKFNVAGNPKNLVGLTDGAVHGAISRSLQRWATASEGSVRFDYWQGTDPKIYLPDSDYNGLSSVYFASNSRSGPALSPNVLGLTQVWYNADSGDILESDTILNDRDFIFTTDPRDTSGYGSGTGGGFNPGRARVFIENVLTHELGHALGLSHSGGLQATMLFMESPEQARLGCDDQTAIHALYPAADAAARGAITGGVVSESGAPVFGAHVLAISRRRGTVVGAGITDRSGRYRIQALEPGGYYLLAEPFLAGAAALPNYYAGMNAEICGSEEPFRRTILTDSSGHTPQLVSVGAGGMADAPAISVRCAPVASFSVGSVTSASLSSAPVINDPADPFGFGVVERVSMSGQAYYRLRGISGQIEIHALSYSLYSPVRTSLALLDSTGTPVPAKMTEQVYVGESGFVNYDSALIAGGLPSGSEDYWIRVTTTPVNIALFPAGPVMVDSSPFLLLTGSMNEASPALAGTLPVNARCRMEENFGRYQSPPGDPPRNSIEGEDGGVGFCGSIEAPRDGGPSSGGGPGPGALIGWFLPWLMMGAMAKLAKRRFLPPSTGLS